MDYREMTLTKVTKREISKAKTGLSKSKVCHTPSISPHCYLKMSINNMPEMLLCYFTNILKLHYFLISNSFLQIENAEVQREEMTHQITSPVRR